MIDFFKALRKRADKRHKELYSPAKNVEFLARRGMECVIEALKEIRVGEPIGAKVTHHVYYHAGEQKAIQATMIRRLKWGTGERPYVDCDLDGRHGTDGEEVVVMVFSHRDPRGRDE